MSNESIRTTAAEKAKKPWSDPTFKQVAYRDVHCGLRTRAFRALEWAAEVERGMPTRKGGKVEVVAKPF